MENVQPYSIFQKFEFKQKRISVPMSYLRNFSANFVINIYISTSGTINY